PAGIGNQANQPEVHEASTSGEGRALRPGPPQGSRVLFVAVRNLNTESPVGYVRASASLAGASAARASAWRSVAAVGAATFVGLAAASAWIAARLHRQVHRLTKVVQAIGRGDFRATIADQLPGDLNGLSSAVSEMRRKMGNDLDRLRQSSQQLSSLLGTMSEGVVAVDNRGRILFANNAARGLLEFATPDTVGRPLLEAVRNRGVQDALDQAFRDAEPTRREVEVGSQARRVVAVQASRLPGEPCPGVLAVLHDVTELRRLENLRQEFVANVSHELKTPLTIIVACAETLLDGALADSANNTMFVRRIAEQADRLHQLILDLISVARIESGQSRFEIDVVPVAPIVDGCLAQFAAKAEAKQIDLAALPPASDVAVLADEEGLEQILGNLVDNALKYTPAGGRVSIGWHQHDGAVTIDVADTGIGIATDDQARVFERFYRVDKARSRELGGTGLGLSIVKHLTQAFGGSVSVASEVGEGSTFSVHLPRG
ncbi:MAG: sensor histidine kinase, partial [Pirellulales bacterium]